MNHDLDLYGTIYWEREQGLPATFRIVESEEQLGSTAPRSARNINPIISGIMDGEGEEKRK